MSRSLWAFTHYLKKALLALCSLKRQGDQHWISLLLVKASPTSCSPARQVPVRIQPWLLLLHILRVQSLRAWGLIWGLPSLCFPSDSHQTPHAHVTVTFSTQPCCICYAVYHLFLVFTQEKTPILQGQLRPSLLYKAFFDILSLYQRRWVSSH